MLPPSFEGRPFGLQLVGGIDEPKVHLPDPQSGLVFATTVIGAILGAVGGAYAARAGSSS